MLWENDLYAVTPEGLAMKPPPVTLIPKSFLFMFGREAKSIPSKYSGNSLLKAINHALKIHYPAEFPSGVKLKPETEGA